MKSEKNNLRMGILKKCLSSLVAFIFVFTGCFMINVPVYAAGSYTINGKTVRYTDFSSSPNDCWNYANNIYNKIWGCKFSSVFSSNDNMLRNLSDNDLTLTTDHLKEYVSNAALGSSLRVCNAEYLHGNDGWGHSQIIVQKDANGFTVLEGGLSTSPYCREKYYTWSGYSKTYSYIKYIKWPGAPAYSRNTDSFISYLESPASGGNYGGGTIQISGYALHKNGLRNVTAWVNGHSMNCSMYNSPSVAKVYPGYPTGKEGFIATIPTSYLNEGENEIGIYAYENDDTPHLIAVRKFNYNSFISELETPKKNVSYNGTLEIKGYALHKNGLRNVTAWVNGQMMGVPMYERTEIADKYPGYPTGNEGFKTEIPLGCLKNGENEISIYAYESNDAAHNIATYKFDYVKDKIVISNVKVSDLTSSGYTVTCDVDAKAGISSVQFPTWSHVNGQDDLVWHQGTISGNKVSCRINVSEHKGDVNCVYQTDIYAYDKANHCETYRNQLLQYIDAVPPVISDVQITNVSENGYTISCVVNDKDSKIDRVQFPTWYGDDNPFQSDSSWRSSAKYSGKLENGRYVYRVNTSDYKNQIGKYTTHIYAWDERGNQSEGYAAEALIKKAHKHEYTSKVKKAATCTEDGIMLYTCKDNDDSYEKVIPATGHQNTELRNVKSATCVSEGYTGDTYCKDCNTKLSTGKTIAKKNHEWDAGKITTKATCTTKGVKTYTCSVCKGTKTEDIAATGHKNTELRNVKSATCESEGYTGDTYCKDCNAKLSTGKTIEKKAHEWDDGKVTTKATCTKKGIKTYTCNKCNITRTEELLMTNHATKVKKFVKEASCDSEGYTGDVYCQECGILLEKGQTIPKLNHNWDAGKVTTKATCTTKGVKTYTCSVCKGTKTEDIAATGHKNTELRNVKSATCASEGYTGDTYCKDCNTKLSTGKTIAKKAHDWNEGKVTTKATCTKKGIKTYTCNNCNATQTEELPMTNHATKVTKFEKEASCESEGYTGDIYCQDCGALLEEGQVIPKLNHNWDAGKIIIKATTTSEGQKKFTCKRCNITRIEKIAKLPVQSIIGKTINDKSSNGVYKVLKNNCVEFIKPLSKKTSANIPDTVKINGKLYKVITISANAFKGITSLKTVTIGKNITSIKSKAFYGCRNLKSITIKTSSLRNRNVGAKAFTGTNAKPKVKVPVKQLKSYKKLLKSKGMSKKAIYKK